MFGDFLTFIRNIFVRKDSKPATEPMLAFFLSTLDVRVKAIEPRIESDAEKKAILTQVQDELKSFPQAGFGDTLWNKAYRLERLVALAEPADGLFVELNRRTNEAIEAAIPTSARLKKALDLAGTDLFDGSKPPKLKDDKAELSARMLLLNALEELHWTYKRRFYARPLIKEATFRTVVYGFIALCIFMGPYLCLYYCYNNNYISIVKWPWLPLYTALSAGLFGTYFSRLIFLQLNVTTLSIEAISDAKDLWTLFLRGIVGMCGALIVYFFLRSGLINGSVFPEFDKFGFDKFLYPEADKDGIIKGIQLLSILPDKQLSLLVIWSFIAGFSERLVPNILASTEQTLSDATQKGKS